MQRVEIFNGMGDSLGFVSIPEGELPRVIIVRALDSVFVLDTTERKYYGATFRTVAAWERGT